MDPKLIKIGIAVIALVAAGAITVSYMSADDESGEDLPEGLSFICLNPDCGDQFNVSYKEYMATRLPNSLVKCPKCDKATVQRALRCPECDGYLEPVGHGDYPAVCKHCGKKLGEVITHGEMPAKPEPKPKSRTRPRG